MDNNNDYFIGEDNLEEGKKEYSDEFEPKWINVDLKGISTYLTTDHNGMPFQQSITPPNHTIAIPENLASDVENGAINLLNYSREELEELSREKHQRELDLAEMTQDLTKELRELSAINENNGYRK